MFFPQTVTLKLTLALFITETCNHHFFILLIHDSLAKRVLTYGILPVDNSHFSIFVPLPI